MRSGLSVYQCRECGSHWGEARPWPEYHGGGPPCHFRIDSEDMHKLAQDWEGVIEKWQRDYEDQQFYKVLGEEVGPEACKTEGCNRLRIKLSIMCREQHFKIIKGYEYQAIKG